MINGYKKLLNDLNMHRRFREAAMSEYEYNQELFRKHGYTSIAIKSLDRVVEDLRYYENMIFLEDENIKTLEEKIKAIDYCIDNTEDITVKVQQLRAMGMKQEDVAELVERHVNTVKNIEKRIKNCT